MHALSAAEYALLVGGVDVPCFFFIQYGASVCVCVAGLRVVRGREGRQKGGVLRLFIDAMRIIRTRVTL